MTDPIFEALCSSDIYDREDAMTLTDWAAAILKVVRSASSSAGFDRDDLMHVIAKATYHKASGGLLSFQFQGWTPEERYEFAQRIVERLERLSRSSNTVEAP